MSGNGIKWTAEGLCDFGKDVAAAMNAEKADDGSRLCDEGFGYEHAAPVDWPDGYRWVVCYYVTGSSEGHYVHLDVMRGYRSGDGMMTALVGDVIHVGMCKTFLGAERAAEIARRCSLIAGA